MANALSVSQTGFRGGVSGGVTVLGVPETIAKLVGAGKIARISLGIAVREFAQLVESQARANIHSVTGNLASGTQSSQVGPYTWEVTSSSLAGDVGEKNQKEYAGFVNYGWGTTPGQFYMERAFEESMPALDAALAVIAVEIERL